MARPLPLGRRSLPWLAAVVGLLLGHLLESSRGQRHLSLEIKLVVDR